MMYVAVSAVTDKYTHTHKPTTVPLAHAPRVNKMHGKQGMGSKVSLTSLGKGR